MQPNLLTRDDPGVSQRVSVLRTLAQSIGQRRYDHWFARQTELRVSGQELIVTVSSAFLQKWLLQNFRQELQFAAQSVLGAEATIRFVVQAAQNQTATSETDPVTEAPTPVSDDVDTAQSDLAQPDIAGFNSARRIDSAQTVLGPTGVDTADLQAEESSSTTPVLPMVAVSLDRAVERTGARSLFPAAERETAENTPEASSRPQRKMADLCDLVPGPCNEFALAAVRQICLSPMEGRQFSALYLYGPVGVGKTHIAEGLQRQLRKQWPRLQVLSLSAENFTNQFTQALRDRKQPGFRQRFRNVDVLIVDEVDFLENKRVIQEEFLHTIQQLERQGKLVVVTADRHPRLLTKTSDELRSRFVSGMVCRLDFPDLTTRQRIIRFKLTDLQMQCVPEVVNYLAERFRGNVRELEGALYTLQAYQQFRGKTLSLTAARQILSDLERDCTRVVRIPEIARAVSELFGVTPEDLQSNTRKKSLSQPRMLAMYLARKHTRSAYTEIGEFFGGRNHSTVMAAERKISETLSQTTPIQIATTAWQMHDLVETLERQLLVG